MWGGGDPYCMVCGRMRCVCVERKNVFLGNGCVWRVGERERGEEVSEDVRKCVCVGRRPYQPFGYDQM